MSEQHYSELDRMIKRYRAIFENSDDMILYFDEDGEVCEKNKVAMELLGYDEEESINVQDIFRTSLKREKDGKIYLNSGNYGDRFEAVAYRKNETCFSVKLYVVLLPEAAGCYGVCVGRDIAEQKKNKRELSSAQSVVEVAQKERDEMVANVTHELRTPVNGIKGLTTNLLDTELTGEQRESLNIIMQCCENMIKIINNILDFSKLQAGKFTIEYREFSFHHFMDNLVKVNQPQVEEKGLKLVCNVGEDVPDRIICDELRLTQVINNLLSNATKFTSVGQITINVIKSVELADEIELFFMVIDTGIGIAPNEMDKLFKSFSQVDASITRKFGGTGLGLSIVKELVGMMGGEINVESEKGRGSTFSFSVRAKKVDAASQTPAESREASSYSFNFGRISSKL